MCIRDRPAAVRRLARIGHERQGGLDLEPVPLGLATHDQGDLRAADRLALSIHDGPPVSAAIESATPPSRLELVPELPLCQTDLPLDWYQEEFKPYAEE